MSDIKVGDFVVVVYECCSLDKGLGTFFTVSALTYESIGCRCGFKGGMMWTADAKDTKRIDRAPIAWLRKIPPLSKEDTLETTKQDQMDKRVYETR